MDRRNFLGGLLSSPRGLAIGAVALILVVAIGYGGYTLLRPAEKGVLPLAPGAFVQG